MAAIFLIVMGPTGCTRTQRLGESPPSYAVTARDEVLIDRIAARRLDRVPLPMLSDELRASVLARELRFMSPSELLALPRPPASHGRHRFEARRGAYFDLWSVAENVSENGGDCAVEVEFLIKSEIDGTCYLGLGASSSVVVRNGEAPIFGVTGWRENLYTHHIVPLRVKRGDNPITIHFQTEKPWTAVPADHLDQEWGANLQLFGSEQAARTRHRQRVAHPFDTAVVNRLDDLQVDGYCEAGQRVELFDLAGTRVATGAVRSNASIEWHDKDRSIQYPFVGFAFLEADVGEPILICGPAGLEPALTELGRRATGRTDPWATRLVHLLRPEFLEQRDAPWSSWGRKLAITTAKLFREPKSAALAARCPSMAMEFGTFQSKMDGTQQYYRYFRSPSVTGPRTLAVIVPTAPLHMRPYLELVADLQNTERTAGLAEARALDVLWVGGVNPDYGGRVARNEVREALQSYLRQFPPNRSDRVYLVGSCSAAVTTLGLVGDGLPVDGAVLCSPVTRRYRERWARGPSLFPPQVSADEQSDVKVEALRDCPILLYWDSDAPGHGDKVGSADFVRRAKAARCAIEAVWVTPPETRAPWGPREAISIGAWMDWIKAAGLSARHDPAALMHAGEFPHPRTVKESLLNGIAMTDAAAKSIYAESWEKTVTAYRGASPRLQPGVTEGRTVVDELRLSTPALLHRLRSDRASVALLAGDELSREMEGATLWGVRLRSEAGQTQVEILTNMSRSEHPPPIDLLVDGACRAALWRRAEDGWVLVQVWL